MAEKRFGGAGGGHAKRRAAEGARRAKRIRLAAAAALALLAGTAFGLPLKVNLGKSMERGIYLLSPKGDRPKVGDAAWFCLPGGNPFSALAEERGYVGRGRCPSGLGPLMKRLSAVAGDRLEAGPDGVRINGALAERSGILVSDPSGRPLPPSLLRSGTVPEGFALLLSDGFEFGFDGRYFGLLPEASLERMERVWAFRRGGGDAAEGSGPSRGKGRTCPP